MYYRRVGPIVLPGGTSLSKNLRYDRDKESITEAAAELKLAERAYKEAKKKFRRVRPKS